MSRVYQILSSIQLKPFDTATESGRSRERYRRIFLTALATFLSKGVHAAVLLISVPMAVGYLGKERYGLWMAITSLVSMWFFSDLGLSQGLMNALSAAHGKQDQQLARRSVSSAFFMLIAMSGLLGAIFVIVHPWIPWPSILNAETPLGIS